MDPIYNRNDLPYTRNDNADNETNLTFHSEEKNQYSSIKKIENEDLINKMNNNSINLLTINFLNSKLIYENDLKKNLRPNNDQKNILLGIIDTVLRNEIDYEKIIKNDAKEMYEFVIYKNYVRKVLNIVLKKYFEEMKIIDLLTDLIIELILNDNYFDYFENIFEEIKFDFSMNFEEKELEKNAKNIIIFLKKNKNKYNFSDIILEEFMKIKENLKIPQQKFETFFKNKYINFCKKNIDFLKKIFENTKKYSSLSFLFKNNKKINISIIRILHNLDLVKRNPNKNNDETIMGMLKKNEDKNEDKNKEKNEDKSLNYFILDLYFQYFYIQIENIEKRFLQDNKNFELIRIQIFLNLEKKNIIKIFTFKPLSNKTENENV